MKTWYVIPARRGSKGLKFKNRRLLPITVDQIPNEEKGKIIVTTDDEYLIDYCESREITTRSRPSHLSNDSASMKDVIKDVITHFDIFPEDKIVILYPTFPQRTHEDIKETIKFLEVNNLKSCTGKHRLKNHPYLSLEKVDNIFAKKTIDHSLYRRQDYPECFGLCHIVYVVIASEVDNIDDQLLNSETGYRWVDDVIDVDYEEDFLQYSPNMTAGIERFNPRVFEIGFEPFMRHFERYFQAVQLLGKTGAKEVWLDYACGSGYGTALLTNFASQVWGFDINKEAVEYARKFYKNTSCGFTSDPEILSVKKFDVIFSIETIEHMPMRYARIFLKRCKELLIDDGTLIITTPIVEETNLNPSNEFHFFECSLEEFLSLLFDSGFNVVDKVLKTTTFTDGETKEQGYFKCQKL